MIIKTKLTSSFIIEKLMGATSYSPYRRDCRHFACDGFVAFRLPNGSKGVSFPIDPSDIPVVASSSKIVQCDRAREAEGSHWCCHCFRSCGCGCYCFWRWCTPPLQISLGENLASTAIVVYYFVVSKAW